MVHRKCRTNIFTRSKLRGANSVNCPATKKDEGEFPPITIRLDHTGPSYIGNTIANN